MFTTAWTASPQLPSEGFTPNWSREGFWRQSLRQVVRLTAGGRRVRVRFSNAYGTSPVRIAGGAVAHAGAVVRLTFGGSAEGEIPARGELVSDAVQLAVAAGESVTVTLYFDAATGPATFHAQAFATSYRGAGMLCWAGRGSPSPVSPGTSCPPSRPTPGVRTGLLSSVTPSPTGSGPRRGRIGGGRTRLAERHRAARAERRDRREPAAQRLRVVRGEGAAQAGAGCVANWPGWTRSSCCWG